MIKDLLFIIVLNGIFQFNGTGLIDGPLPGFGNFVASLVYLFFWFVYGLYKGKKSNKKFIILVTTYCVFGLLLDLILVKALNWGIPILTVPILYLYCFLFAPLNGLNYFEDMIFMAPYFYILFPLLLFLTGYLITDIKTIRQK